MYAQSMCDESSTINNSRNYKVFTLTSTVKEGSFRLSNLYQDTKN